jgi:4-hydroxy-tetrahydrodipicolinate reductase
VSVPGITIFGITGRMGQTLLRALREGDGVYTSGAATRAVPAGGMTLVGAVASPHSSRLGLDAASEGAPTGVTVTADSRAALRAAAVAVDFSLPQCVAANAQACVLAKVALVVGATGFDAAVRA